MTQEKDLRITIMIPHDLAIHARKVQSELIVKTGKSVSFSAVASILISIGLKDIGQARALLKKKYS